MPFPEALPRAGKWAEAGGQGARAQGQGMKRLGPLSLVVSGGCGNCNPRAIRGIIHMPVYSEPYTQVLTSMTKWKQHKCLSRVDRIGPALSHNIKALVHITKWVSLGNMLSERSQTHKVTCCATLSIGIWTHRSRSVVSRHRDAGLGRVYWWEPKFSFLFCFTPPPPFFMWSSLTSDSLHSWGYSFEFLVLLSSFPSAGTPGMHAWLIRY